MPSALRPEELLRPHGQAIEFAFSRGARENDFQHMRFGIALGSNVGARMENLRRAVDAVVASPHCVRLLAAAPVYETDPVDCPPGSAAFYNSVIEVEAEASPHEMLRELRAIEARLGRPGTHGHHEPRTIDLDLLYAEDLVVSDAELVLPHPRIAERRFVLQPLADIRPGLVLPGRDVDAATLLSRLKGGGDVRRLETGWLSRHF